jgi:hypothetical protein
MIKQDELINIIEKRTKVKRALAKIQSVNAEIADFHVELLARLQKGEKIENGKWYAVIKTVNGKPSVKWKEEFIAVKGNKKAQDLIEDARKHVKSSSSAVIVETSEVVIS